MIGGSHLLAERGEGQRRLGVGASPCGESRNQAGAPPAHGPIGPTERGSNPGRSGLVWEV
jgi:hypothetical protein